MTFEQSVLCRSGLECQHCGIFYILFFVVVVKSKAFGIVSDCAPNLTRHFQQPWSHSTYINLASGQKSI